MTHAPDTSYEDSACPGSGVMVEEAQIQRLIGAGGPVAVCGSCGLRQPVYERSVTTGARFKWHPAPTQVWPLLAPNPPMPPTYAIVQDDSVARQWWRVVRPYTWLRRRGQRVGWGHTIDLHDLALPDETQVIVFSASVPQREHWQALVGWMVAQRRNHGRTFVYDIDDDAFTSNWSDWMVETGAGSRKTRAELEDARELRTSLMALCDGVTVSTPKLADTVAELTDRPIWLVPNAIDFAAFRRTLAPAWHKAEDEVVIGWAGGFRRESDLVLMLRAWGEIARRYEQTSFRIAGWRPHDLYRFVPEDRVTEWPWTSLDKYGQSMQVDIGCCPVPRTPFDAHRSPIKAMEFACAGAAVIGARHIYSSIIGDGVTTVSGGLYADTTDEWIDALDTYVSKEWLRQAHRPHLMRNVQPYALQAGAWRYWSEAYAGIRKGEKQTWQTQHSDRNDVGRRSHIEAGSHDPSQNLSATLPASTTITEPSTHQDRGTA